MNALRVASVVGQILDYGGWSAYSLVQRLSKTFCADTAAWLLPAVLNSPIDVHKVCSVLDYKVKENRASRLFVRAKDDLPLMNPETFKKAIVLQLALTHLRNAKIYPHTITDVEICGLLLRSISGCLVPPHAVALRVITYLREHGLVADVNVGHDIPQVCIAWRKSLYDDLCIHSFMALLANKLLFLRT